MTTEKKTGLVLGGGGARGCYEVGCWQAFQACDIHFDVVAGTSIGAIVGAIYTQQTLQPLVEFVTHMEPQDIAVDMFAMPENLEDFQNNREEMQKFFHKYFTEGTDISPLKDAFDKMFDYDTFMASPIDFACMTFNVTRMMPQPVFKKDMTREDAASWILASASCYPAFPMMTIGKDKYVDGGYADNIPTALAQEMGAQKLVVIDVHGPGRTHPLPAGAVLFEPIARLGNFLDFKQEMAVRSMRLGYLETMKRYDKFCGYVYTFPKSSWPKIYMINQYLDMKLQEYDILPSFEIARNLFGTFTGHIPVRLQTKYTQNYAGGAYIEALAAAVHLPEDALYGYGHFLTELYKRLKAIPQIKPPRNVRQSLQLLHESSREEVMNFLHAALVHHGGKLPVTLRPLANMFNHEYILAVVWYCLYSYLNR